MVICRRGSQNIKVKYDSDNLNGGKDIVAFDSSVAKYVLWNAFDVLMLRDSHGKV